MIYLDNCATTRLRKEVKDLLIEEMELSFANPSSLHRLGLGVEKKIEEARRTIANYLRVEREEIYFTSGGTESNNIALKQGAKRNKRRGKHIITTAIEHPSVLETLKDLEGLGYEIDYLGVDKYGLISLEDLKDKLREDTILVSIMEVNNEIGSIQPVKEAGRIIKNFNPQILYHVDGIQGFCKIDNQINQAKIDFYSFSGHKIHGPKGIGGLYVNKDVKIDPLVFGGKQEKGLRSGTENIHGILGLAMATKEMEGNQAEERLKIRGLKEYLLENLESLDDIIINSPLDLSSDYIINLSIKNTRGEILLHYLEEEEIYISTSSACSSKGTDISHVLKAIGLDRKYIEGTIRICLSYDLEKEDIDKFVDVLYKSVEELREIIMR